MNLRLLLICAALFAAAPGLAADPLTCSAPGLTVVTDPAGDQTGAPATSHADILSLALAEPASTDGKDRLVFTYKVSGLSTLPPDTLWIVRFSTDVAPANGDEQYFVAMLTGPDAAAHFVYGTEKDVAQGARLFTPAGALDGMSNFKADGTITLALDKSKIPGLEVGGTVSAMIPYTHVISPTDGTQPFAYGFRSVGSAQFSLDETAVPDDYAVVGSAACPGKSGTDIFAAGALPPLTLVVLLLPALRRRGASSEPAK